MKDQIVLIFAPSVVFGTNGVTGSAGIVVKTD